MQLPASLPAGNVDVSCGMLRVYDLQEGLIYDGRHIVDSNLNCIQLAEDQDALQALVLIVLPHDRITDCYAYFLNSVEDGVSYEM